MQLVEFDGQEWLYLRALHPDVALIRATTADESGNLTFEREGAFLGAYDVALAAHNNGGVVIAQVARRVAAGSLPAQAVRVPSVLVDAVVVVPDPRQTTQTDYDPAISGEVRVPSASFELAEWSLQKVIARRAALELREGEAVNLGFGISALVPRILLEEGLDGAVTWVIEQGAVGGMPLLGFQFGCAANSQAIIPSPDQFSYFQGGGFDRSFLSFMQIDRAGNINVSRLAARPHVTAGVGGFVDITANARNIVISALSPPAPAWPCTMGGYASSARAACASSSTRWSMSPSADAAPARPARTSSPSPSAACCASTPAAGPSPKSRPARRWTRMCWPSANSPSLWRPTCAQWSRACSRRSAWGCACKGIAEVGETVDSSLSSLLVVSTLRICDLL